MSLTAQCVIVISEHAQATSILKLLTSQKRTVTFCRVFTTLPTLPVDTSESISQPSEFYYQHDIFHIFKSINVQHPYVSSWVTMKEKPGTGLSCHNRNTLHSAIPPEFDIERFIRIQDQVVVASEEWPLAGHPQRTEYERALQELRNGRKPVGTNNHWIRFVFPRIL